LYARHVEKMGDVAVIAGHDRVSVIDEERK